MAVIVTMPWATTKGWDAAFHDWATGHYNVVGDTRTVELDLATSPTLYVKWIYYLDASIYSDTEAFNISLDLNINGEIYNIFNIQTTSAQWSGTLSRELIQTLRQIPGISSGINAKLITKCYANYKTESDYINVLVYASNKSA